jgi:hypothetical protein
MPLPNDLELANLCAAIYTDGGDWDHVDTGAGDDIYYGIKNYSDVSIVVFRGSITAHDWYEDLKATPYQTAMGTVHQGFHEGMPNVWNEIKGIANPIIVTGHSLGAARADILCGLMLLDGRKPLRRVVFGEPKPGLPDFARFLSDIPAASYRNGNSRNHDLVTDVPLKLLPPFNFVHPTKLTLIDEEPSGTLFERYGLFGYHHISLYQAGVAAIKEANQ